METIWKNTLGLEGVRTILIYGCDKLDGEPFYTSLKMQASYDIQLSPLCQVSTLNQPFVEQVGSRVSDVTLCNYCGRNTVVSACPAHLRPPLPPDIPSSALPRPSL